MVVWTPIPGYEGLYDVSNKGDLRSWRVPITKGTKKLSEPRLRKATRTKTGYHRISLTRNHREQTFSVARLVLLAFVGECPRGLESAHLNGIRHDNRLENLCWTTHTNNELHKKYHGTFNPRYKLSQAIMRDIATQVITGASVYAAAVKYGVSPSMIYKHLEGMTWRKDVGSPLSFSNAGERNNQAKLTASDVFMIRNMLTGTDAKDTSVAKEFGVCTETIRRIRRNITWKSLT